ncbi:penicillin-binding protein 2 [Nocardioides sp.]|uniref:peptidoglycan D,D-transpeptidase FtsI family protein n=1 Tax=Nocardioides sp. TaxID=35761 RepID=UPI002BA17F68|nr:penicillin-binding protein 2 [Nocardioides sp.]HXH78050.1 penicillin-binding protein 2 [Nocardioides sp.]
MSSTATRKAASRPQDARRGAPAFRLRFGLIVIAMVLSFFGARLVQLQGIDPNSYAEMAAAESVETRILPAERGDILDRNGLPLADSVRGKMVVADPVMTADDAPELATLLSQRLDVDYFEALARLREGGSQFEYIARRVPSTIATDLVAELAEAGYEGITLRDDPIRSYPADDVGANLLGFIGTDEPLYGFERTFDRQLSGTDGTARFTVGGGNRIPLGENTLVPPKNGAPLTTTVDMDLQWFTQRVLAQTLQQYKALSGVAIVMDSRTGEVMALADAPTFDANKALESEKDDLGSRAISDAYEPGSVEKVLTAAALIDAGKVTPRTKLRIPPSLPRQDRVIGDWFDHGNIKLTMAGVIAKSSNIGTVLAADAFTPLELVGYLQKFGLGQRTDMGLPGESAGILTPGDVMTSQTKDRVAFGQSVSVNAVQMAAAVNTIANGGVRISPSIIKGSATTEDGTVVGTDVATETRVVSEQAARQTARMMERVVDPEAGVAPGAQVPGYLVAGKTGTAQRVSPTCGCYDGSTTVSFGGFAPADDPRFTVYVVVHKPQVDGGGGSIAGPAFSRIMGYALSRYRVPPTDGKPSRLPVEW